MHKSLTEPVEITWHAASDQDVMTRLDTGRRSECAAHGHVPQPDPLD
jgi:hypothetical protein